MTISSSAEFAGMGLRTYFSIQHLQATGYFSKRAAELDISRLLNSDEESKAALLGYVAATLFSSAAFLEALANEMFADALDSSGGHLSGLTSVERKLIGEMGSLDTVERSQVTGKFDVMLRAAGREPLKGEVKAQDVTILLKLRNELVHYKAAFFDAGTEGMVRAGSFAASQLKTQIESKFPLRVGSAGGLESDSWIGAGCAQWALQSVLAYSDEVFSRLSIEPYYDYVRGRI